jgi:hypothetical protein
LLLATHTLPPPPLPLQDFVGDIADLCPEYCVRSIIPELLASDAPESQLIGLRALHLVATSVPQGVAAGLELRASRLKRSAAHGVGGGGGGSTSSSASGFSGTSGSKRLVQVSWCARVCTSACVVARRDPCPPQQSQRLATALRHHD